MMKNKALIIAVASVLAVASIFILWRVTHAPKKKVVIHKRIVTKEAVKKKALPPIQKKFPNPKIAIVMDDFGYNTNDLDALLAPKLPITFSVLPNLPYSRRVTELARSKGYEVILHLPLEAIDKKAPAEPDTINTGMDEKTVITILDKQISATPGLKGVSNHQGSKATEDMTTMSIIMGELKNKKLFYFDSLVTDRSICAQAAKSAGISYARRDMFLDNDPTPEAVEKQLLSLRRFAFRRGNAIAVCHDRKNTIAVLSRMMPQLSAEGVEFVALSEMVK